MFCQQSLPRFPFSFVVITDVMYKYVLIVLQSVIPRGHTRRVLLEGSDSMTTPCFLGILVAACLRV
jgi:hypothetical protein